MEIKEKIFSGIASLIGKHQWLKQLVFNYAFAHPYQHLVHKDGVPYMGRWWLMPHWMLKPDEKGDPEPKKWVPIKIRLHHIRTEDYDRNFHDHPSDYRTLIIDGWYVERDLFGVDRTFSAGSSRSARAETFHRIVEVSPGGTWTIFIMWKKRNSWGFIVNDKKVHWRDFQG